MTHRHPLNRPLPGYGPTKARIFRVSSMPSENRSPVSASVEPTRSLFGWPTAERRRRQRSGTYSARTPLEDDVHGQMIAQGRTARIHHLVGRTPLDGLQLDGAAGAKKDAIDERLPTVYAFAAVLEFEVGHQFFEDGAIVRSSDFEVGVTGDDQGAVLSKGLRMSDELCKFSPPGGNVIRAFACIRVKVVNDDLYAFVENVRGDREPFVRKAIVPGVEPPVALEPALSLQAIEAVPSQPIEPIVKDALNLLFGLRTVGVIGQCNQLAVVRKILLHQNEVIAVQLRRDLRNEPLRLAAGKPLWQTRNVIGEDVRAAFRRATSTDERKAKSNDGARVVHG